jgi:hypothetical protein
VIWSKVLRGGYPQAISRASLAPCDRVGIDATIQRDVRARQVLKVSISCCDLRLGARIARDKITLSSVARWDWMARQSLCYNSSVDVSIKRTVLGAKPGSTAVKTSVPGVH